VNVIAFLVIDLQPLMDEFEEFSGTMSELNEQSAMVWFPSTNQPPAWHPTRRRQYTCLCCWQTLHTVFLKLTSMSVFADGRISTHADPTSTCRAISRTAHL